jgi:hypothetical protein
MPTAATGCLAPWRISLAMIVKVVDASGGCAKANVGTHAEGATVQVACKDCQIHTTVRIVARLQDCRIGVHTLVKQ